jgi:hypothetical protein
MKRVVAAMAALAALTAAGCSKGSRTIVPVSGVVKLNGKPYKNAVVSFQPLGDKDNPNPGRGSSGVTDENGRYTLIYDGEKPGAITGKHRVMIATQLSALKSANWTGPGEDPGPVDPRQVPDPIPSNWNERSKQEFEVPAGGTDSADFDIQTGSAK